MILKAVILFLLFIAVMAMIQKALMPNRKRLKTMDRLRCPTCRRVNFSNNPAPCERPDCRYR
jgi:hypothetical protein